jgi:hypothetical protein
MHKGNAGRTRWPDIFETPHFPEGSAHFLAAPETKLGRFSDETFAKLVMLML